MNQNNKIINYDWRYELEFKYVLMCKVCHKKVIDPDKKNNQQIFTKSKCPNCLNKKKNVE